MLQLICNKGYFLIQVYNYSFYNLQNEKYWNSNLKVVFSLHFERSKIEKLSRKN